jgi:ABC-2 type transport system permease protein
MLGVILKKELKAFFTNKGNLVFMFLLPILLISIFSFALGDYVKAEYGTFDNGNVLYVKQY